MKIKIGTRWERIWECRGVLEVYLEWRDLWVGVFVGKDAVYVCPVPCVVLRFSRGSKRDPMSYLQDVMTKVVSDREDYLDALRHAVREHVEREGREG